MTYQEAINYIFDRQQFGIKFGLSNISTILKLLSNPQDKIKAVHIAGTNGKGSTASIISSILQSAGYKVGLYTSPHLIDFRERIRVNGQYITKRAVIELTQRIKELGGALNLTYFEFGTAMAFAYFAEQEVDFAILETGMGGRLDATNVVNPLVSIITNVGYDHTKYLGKTLSEIAGEKAAIIKQKGIVLTAAEKKEALKVIKAVCQKKSAKLIQVNKKYKWELIEVTLEGQRFNIYSNYHCYTDLQMSILGEHQLINAVTAIGAVEVLSECGYHIEDEAIFKGVREAKWPGRLDVVGFKPLVILDGAHNPPAAKQLRRFLERIPQYQDLILIIGMLDDKDVSGFINELIPLANKIVITKAEIDRSLEPAEIVKKIKKRGKEVIIKRGVSEAIKFALTQAGEDDLICITGSLYVVGEAVMFFHQKVEVEK